MRWLLPAALLLSSLAVSADTPQALRDLLVKMDQAARLRQPLDAKDLPLLLGLKLESGCLASASDSCWRELSAPALGWPGTYGSGDALGTVIVLNRWREKPPCVRAADLAKALPTPPRMEQQMAGFGHMRVDGLEMPVPRHERMPTWRYAAPRAGRETELVLNEEQGCVKEITLRVDFPLPFEDSALQRR
jgi:hypothetical protein